MQSFIARRLVNAVPVLLLVLLIIFALVRLIPGDPAVTLLGPGASQQQIQALRAQLRLDQPLPAQLFGYIGGLAHGDLGRSLRTGRPIAQDVRDFLPATIELALSALVLAVVLGIPLALWSATHAHGASDQLIRLFSLVGVSAPAFWLALLLQVIFGVALNWLPVSGRIDVLLHPTRVTGFLLLDALLTGSFGVFINALVHLILPACVLGAFLVGTVARVLRASIMEQLSEDYARTAVAKGLVSRRVLFGHVLRNSLLPTVTLVGLKFADLLGGAILTETVFAWPGMGRYMYDAIAARDYPVIQSVTLLFAVIYVVSSLLVDLLYGVLDPRIRVGEA